MEVYVDPTAAMAHEGWAAATTFELAHWGAVGQGPDETAAIADLALRTGRRAVVVERLDPGPDGAERLFAPEHRPATPAQRRATQAVLDVVRARTLALLDDLTEAELDAPQPGRDMPGWADWRTLRGMLRHVADTESRYYLACLGRGRPAETDLRDELLASAAHARDAVAHLPADLVIDAGVDGWWSTTKVLRRLAWHEAGELEAMTDLVARLRSAS